MLQSFQSRKEIAKRHPYFYIDQKRKDQIIMIVISFICEEFFFSCRVEIAPHFGPLETWTLQSTSSSSLLVFGHFFIVRKIHNDIPFFPFFAVHLSLDKMHMFYNQSFGEKKGTLQCLQIRNIVGILKVQ